MEMDLQASPFGPEFQALSMVCACPCEFLVCQDCLCHTGMESPQAYGA